MCAFIWWGDGGYHTGIRWRLVLLVNFGHKYIFDTFILQILLIIDHVGLVLTKGSLRCLVDGFEGRTLPRLRHGVRCAIEEAPSWHLFRNRLSINWNNLNILSSMWHRIHKLFVIWFLNAIIRKFKKREFHLILFSLPTLFVRRGSALNKGFL